MKNDVTIHDIAKMLNVSPSTVSRALQDNPRISISTRKAIQDLAREQGYRPNNIASSLRKGTSTTIGVIVPRLNRYFFSGIISSMEESLNEAGYNIMVCQTQEDHRKEIQNIRSLLNMRVDTIFISLSTGSKDSLHLKEIIDRGIKVIMFDRVDESLPVPIVKLDDYKGAFDTVNHLISQGYRKIAHFAGPEHISVYKERKKGYLDALSANGLIPDDKYVYPDVITREKGSKTFQSIMEAGDIPDAIFSASDFSALGALLVAQKNNIRVPGELGIAGFANEPYTEFVQPGITSTDQKPAEMGRLIADIFLKKYNLTENRREILSPTLIIRGSTLKADI